MVDPVVGFRFRPTDEEIVGHYVRPKNLGSNTSHVDEVMNTVDIYSFDPWELPCKSRINSTDEVWYFFGCKKNQQHMLNKQSRKTKSGFWKKTGDTTDISRKRGGDGEKIGEKRVFVFSSKIPSGSKSKSKSTPKPKSKSKSDWVMHEYIATFTSPDSPNQTMMMTYTVCKVIFKGDPRDLPSSSSAAGEIEHDFSLNPHHVNNNPGGLSTETENPNQVTSTISLIPHDVNNSSGGLSTEIEVTMTYTVCKVMFKGDPTDLPSSSYSAGENEHDCSLIPHVVDSNSGVLNTEAENPHQITTTISLVPHVDSTSGGLSTETENPNQVTSTVSGGLSTEPEVNPHQFSAFLHLEEDARTEDETLRALNSLLNYVHAEEEHVNLLFRQEDRNDYRPKKSLTGFISDDDSDSDSITTTCSTKSSSTCVSFGSSNPPIRLPESPCSTIESGWLTQEVSKALGPNTVISEKKMSPCDDEAQGSDTRGDQMGQDMVIKNKKAGFIYRMIQRFTKKIKLCSCISRT